MSAVVGTTVALLSLTPSASSSAPLAPSVDAPVLAQLAPPTTPACIVSPADMLGWWKSEGDLTGTVGPTLAGSTGSTDGVVGQAMSFDGTARATTGLLPAVSTTVSVDAWGAPRRVGGARPGGLQPLDLGRRGHLSPLPVSARSVDEASVGPPTTPPPRPGPYPSGAAYLFTSGSPSWSQLAKLAAPTPAVNDQFGFSLAVNGVTAAAGAPGRDPSGTDSGAGFTFGLF